jgi:hypothetical protein
MAALFNRDRDKHFSRDLPPQLAGIRVELAYLSKRLTADKAKDLRAAGAAIAAANRALEVAEALIDRHRTAKEEQ